MLIPLAVASHSIRTDLGGSIIGKSLAEFHKSDGIEHEWYMSVSPSQSLQFFLRRILLPIGANEGTVQGIIGIRRLSRTLEIMALLLVDDVFLPGRRNSDLGGLDSLYACSTRRHVCRRFEFQRILDHFENMMEGWAHLEYILSCRGIRCCGPADSVTMGTTLYDLTLYSTSLPTRKRVKIPVGVSFSFIQ